MLTFEDSSTPVSRKLKILVYGGPGAGKTMFALGAPSPLVLDTESSTDAYRGRADIAPFTVAKTASPKEIAPVLEELHAKGFIQAGPRKLEPQTLVIDSFSVIWQVCQEAGQKRAERRAVDKGRKPDEEALAFGDWNLIKRPIQSISTRVINLPVHVILTAREKDLYDDNKTNPKKIGVVPDIERNIPYVFDLVLRLGVDDKGKRFAIVEKSRFIDFPPGKRIDNPSWQTFAALEQAGEATSFVPDVDAAAEDEAKPEPAAWTKDNRLNKAKVWRDEQGLTDADLNAALDCDDWTQTHYSTDEFKARVYQYVQHQVSAQAAEPATPPAADEPAGSEAPAEPTDVMTTEADAAAATQS